ncbi:MAG: NAD(P)H-dependent oxidoreductase subunit E [Peptoniphilaceae bacterium]|nr:NAD(P)H-dependent oxidoreductase subunit E [Peptoniphilaceae bacterium]MDD7383287.1 NAD(P)H-dependent oxidoreductase subunit E [Peptoniphilaceae bacterium]MDY3738342.1 NAD(P)H-dependent oxidoreductase subunit E [Peptoniphilaceae bacterium]
MKIKVCVGAKCTMLGADTILDTIDEILQDLEIRKESIDKDFKVDLEMIPCPGVCKEEEKIGPVVFIDNEMIAQTTPQEIMERILDKAYESKFDD